MMPVLEKEPIVAPGPAGAWDDGFTCNPAASVHSNGTILLIYKARSLEHSQGMYEGVALTPHWNSTYVKKTPDAPLDLPSDCEDAGIYRTNTSEGEIYRMLTHCGCAGQYMWSKDGFHWARTTSPQGWCTNVPFTDGVNRTLSTRQRPKWLVNNKGVATHVFTGVNRDGDSAMGHTWTMAAAVSNPK